MALDVVPILYFLGITLLFPLFTLLLCFAVLLQNLHKKYERIPGPKRGSFVWGNAKEFRRLQENGTRKEEIFRQLAQKHGPLIVTWEVHKPIITLSSPELVKNVLTVLKLPKDPQVCESLANLFGQRFLGRGFATETDHEAWMRKRLVIDGGLNKLCLERLMGRFSSCCDEFIDKLVAMADGKTEVDLGVLVKRVSLDIIGKVAFGIDINSISDPDTPFYTALEECKLATKWAADHPFHPWDVTSFEYQNDIKEAVKYLRDFGKKMMDRHRASMEDDEDVPCDVLGAMLTAADENGDITLEDLLDDFVSVCFIGYKQSAGLLSSILMETSQHQEIQEKLAEEFNAVLYQPKKHEDLRKLQYCDLVLKETLRLHPPVTTLSHITTKGEKIGGHFIPEGTRLQILPYILHRDPDIWDNPDEFIPERFPDMEEKSSVDYMPFGLGMQECIGKDCIDFLVKIVLSKLLQKLVFKAVPFDKSADGTSSASSIDVVKCILYLR